MPGRHLTLIEKVEIISDSKKGESHISIAKKFNVSRSTIVRVIGLAKQGIVTRKKTVRPTKLATSDIENIKEHVQNFPFLTEREVLKSLNLNVCEHTLRKYLSKSGIQRRVSPKKFIIKDLNKEERIVFARANMNKSYEDWNRFVFTDESGIDNSGFHRRHVWRPRNSRFDQQFVYKAPNKTLRLNFFSYVSSKGTGPLYFYERMDSSTYCQVVTEMIDNLEVEFGQENFFIIHDIARFSQSKFVEDYFRIKNYSKYFIKIPAYSPDINIIENLWAFLKMKRRMQYSKMVQ